jgi:hypothetical protein
MGFEYLAPFSHLHQLTFWVQEGSEGYIARKTPEIIIAR